MTKEDLYKVLCTILKPNEYYIKCQLDGFFDSSVVIPRGATLQYLTETGEYVDIFNLSNDINKYRIKPSEPIFEYKVCMYFHDGTYEHTEKYFTKEEYLEFGFPTCCLLEDDTKRERR